MAAALEWAFLHLFAATKQSEGTFAGQSSSKLDASCSARRGRACALLQDGDARAVHGKHVSEEEVEGPNHRDDIDRHKERERTINCVAPGHIRIHVVCEG